MMYFIKTPRVAKRLFPNYIWDVATDEPVVYFTFDDGPIPEVTPRILDILAAYDAKATFFCVGDNVRKHPDIFQKIIQADHRVGNHTFNHLNSCRTPQEIFLDNVEQCARWVPSKMFRPPYGRIGRQTAQLLQKRGYKIIMWDIMCGDFDRRVTWQNCHDRIVNHVRPGSIVVLHDSLKTINCVADALPAALEKLQARGYRFEALPF